MELCLGTVQFGMDYGINGKKRPSPNDCVKWMDYATNNGISSIDTAQAYGYAEDIVGSFLRKKTIPRDRLFISTKLMPNILDGCKSNEYDTVIKEQLTSSLHKLGLEYVDAYLFHSSGYVFRDEMVAALYKMKKEGLARKVGVSVYYPEEAFACLNNSLIDFVQAPFSLFDQRMRSSGFIDSIDGKELQLYTRSAFLQGLLLMKEERVPYYLQKAKPMIGKLDQICVKEHLTKVELALAYIKREKNISNIVFGVHSLQQLEEDISSFDKKVDPEILNMIDQEFSSLDADIVIPSLWKK